MPMPPLDPVHIVGAGLAGSEAAFVLAERDIAVVIHEMRPGQKSPAHKTGFCAELVCSNSFKSKSLQNGPGLLKRELEHAGSLIMKAAKLAEIPGGEALTVDRDVFSKTVTETLRSHPLISWCEEEVIAPPTNALTLIATGPLTSDKLSQWLGRTTGDESLYFYDAIAPVVAADSIDFSKAFIANRYDKGEEDAYVNCPMTESEYRTFVLELINADKVEPKAFEEEKFFRGCQPIEAIAASGSESLRFGPMKPVGLTDPKTGERPFAVVQLRAENRAKTAYNIVGFQTKLKYGEQPRVLRLIPALKNAEFLRQGSMHRNTFVCGPKCLSPNLALRKYPLVHLAGQITGVEGYLESTASGFMAASFIYQRMIGQPHDPPPPNTAMGALLRHVVAGATKDYQPANIHFGLFDQMFFDELPGLRKDQLRTAIGEQCEKNFSCWWGRQ